MKKTSTVLPENNLNYSPFAEGNTGTSTPEILPEDLYFSETVCPVTVNPRNVFTVSTDSIKSELPMSAPNMPSNLITLLQKWLNPRDQGNFLIALSLPPTVLNVKENFLE